MHTVNRLVVTFLLNSLWQTTLVTAVTWACSRLLRNVASRHVYHLWVTCLVLSILLPSLCLLHPGEIVPKVLVPQLTVNATSAGVSAGSWQAGWLRLVTTRFSFDSRWITGLSGLYLLFAAGCLGRFWVSWQKAKHIRRSARECELPSSVAAIAHRCERAFGLRYIPILRSALVHGPLVTGIWSRVVIVPEFLVTEGDEEQWLSALAHEFAHIRRRDCLFNLLQHLLYWPILFHPATLLMKRQISAAREQVCDEMATGSVIDRPTYARSLVSIATRMQQIRAPQPIYSLGIFDADSLEERIMKLLQNNSSPAFRRKAAMLTTVVCLALCVSVSAFSLKIHDSGKTALLALFPVGPSEQGVLKVGPGITPPKVVSQVQPVYPADAKRAKREGVVVLAVVVTEDGVVQEVQVAKSAAPDFDQNAVDAVRQWKFEPAWKDGKPVKVETHIEVSYSLKK
jgi:TonB family protein